VHPVMAGVTWMVIPFFGYFMIQNWFNLHDPGRVKCL